MKTSLQALCYHFFYYKLNIKTNFSVIKVDTADKYAKEIVQDLDHFNRQVSVTFKQRYFLNDTFWTGSSSGAPVFLCVGGEGPPLDWTVLVSSVHCNDMVELAPKYGALMVALVRYQHLCYINFRVSSYCVFENA